MLQERVDYFSYLFEMLQDTNSRMEKEALVADIPNEYKEDFDFIIECLTGKHKFGYKYKYIAPYKDPEVAQMTVKEVLQLLLLPRDQGCLSEWYITNVVICTTQWFDFFEPIVNRTLRLGIGNSLIEKEVCSPMLAKKLEDDIKFDKNGYFITEKLDGNRCIAMYDGEKWIFTSRNGKPMHVDFDMSNLDTNYIYDGEVLTRDQTNNSKAIYDMIQYGKNSELINAGFNEASGIINKHTLNKDLVFNIFDIVDSSAKYEERREYLNTLRKADLGNDIRILPTLAHFATKEDLFEGVSYLLDKVVDSYGEGLMINLASGAYLQKRTDQLLKVKKVHTMDMKVIGLQDGTGKYEGAIGALHCHATTEDGKEIDCMVGTGLSDTQRILWASYPDHILNEIVEISYFSLSQSDANRGSNLYSLRFPRLKRVRIDKSETSEF